jgi:hypothetical protein
VRTLLDAWAHFEKERRNLGEFPIIKLTLIKTNKWLQYQVRWCTHMILFQNGKQLWRQSGVVEGRHYKSSIGKK